MNIIDSKTLIAAIFTTAKIKQGRLYEQYNCGVPVQKLPEAGEPVNCRSDDDDDQTRISRGTTAVCISSTYVLGV